ncbi:hypothetical protein GE21DRAFT_1347360, partial [Neurospora crassa]
QQPSHQSIRSTDHFSSGHQACRPNLCILLYITCHVKQNNITIAYHTKQFIPLSTRFMERPFLNQCPAKTCKRKPNALNRGPF